jgi:hypothetical protein
MSNNSGYVLKKGFEGIQIGTVKVTNENITARLAKEILAKDPDKEWFDQVPKKKETKNTSEKSEE